MAILRAHYYDWNATSYVVTGPLAGLPGDELGPFVVTPNGSFSGSITLVPTGAGLTSAQSQTLTWSGGSEAKSASFTPPSSGSLCVAGVSSWPMPNPRSVYANIRSSGGPTTRVPYHIVGPPAGQSGVASSPFTVKLSGPAASAAAITVTPAGGGISTPIAIAFSIGEKEKTFTLTPSSTGVVTLTTTNDQGWTDIAPITFVSSSVVTVDSAWLSGKTPPYSMSTANTIYRLAQDISTPRGAFSVLANGTTLDLNGYTLTYDNGGYPQQFVNSSFETGDLSGWDASNAAGMSVVPAASPGLGGFGSYRGQWTVPAGATQSLLSSAVTLPTSGIPYLAGVELTASGEPSVTVAIVDATTGVSYGSYTQPSGTVGNGGMLNASFTPTASQLNVRFKITVVSGGAASTTRFDWAQIVRRGVYGVYVDFGKANVGVTSSSPGGQLVQGDGMSAYSDAINAHSGPYRLSVSNIGISVNGQDTCGVISYSIQDQFYVGNTFSSTVSRITNRQANLGHLQITCAAPPKNCFIEDNAFSGSHQNSIVLFGVHNQYQFSAVVIAGNVDSHRSVWPNGYFLQLQGVNNIRVENNSANALGRGIMLQATKAGGGGYQRNVEYGVVRNNTIVVCENGTVEAGRDLTAVALRARNYDGRIGDMEIHDNLFCSYTGEHPGLSDRWCSGSRLSVYNDHAGTVGQMNDCRVIVRDNTFKAVILADDGYGNSRGAFALSLGKFDAGTGMILRDNVLESNDLSVQMGSSDGDGPHDVTLWRNIFRKSSEGISTIRADSFQVRGYVAFTGVFNNGTCDRIRFLSSTYEGGAAESEDFFGGGAKSVQFGWMLTVTVTDGSGSPQPGATVTATTSLGDATSVTTDASGIAMVPACIRKWTASGGGYIETSSTPVALAATAGSLSGSASVSPSGDSSLTIVVS